MADLAPTTTYPISLPIERPETFSRFWAIPLIGALVKGIILIPHIIIVYVLIIALYFAHLVIWIPVLFTGRYPDWAFGLNAGAIRWLTRMSVYGFGLTDKYPEFSMESPGDIVIERPETSNRLWAFPLLGIVVKSIILIPHFIVLYVLAIVVGLAHLVIWIPVLLTGQYPNWGFSLSRGYTLWTARLYAYFLGLTDAYPPFSMS
jgi:hypothetical protein